MSQRIVIIDDHSNAEIEIAEGHKTRASITLTRVGQEHSISWDDLNLTDDSWDLLIKTIREFCPNAQPNADELDASADAEQVTTSNERIQAMEHASQPAPATPTPVAVKRDGKAVRAWWYALDSATIKALALPMPDRSRNIGKLPVAVYDAYDASRA